MTGQAVEWTPSDVARLPRIRALVLDDSSFDRQRIRRIGADLDLKLSVDEAGSVEGLEDRLDREAFDVFLIDYVMPGTDGLEALEMIRRHRRHNDAVAIMISGQADPRLAIRAMKQGCQDFIVKSDISRETLRGAVLSALHHSRQFARYFDDPQPPVGLDQIRGLMRIAANDPAIRDILRRTLEDALREAARAIGHTDLTPTSAEIVRFLTDFDRPGSFDRPDSFDFRPLD